MAFSPGAQNTVQLAVSWLVAAAVVIGLVAHFDEVRSALGLKLTSADFGVLGEAPRAREAQPRHSERSVEIRANRSGHFETRVHINGRAVDVMVDTGATVVALTWEDARAAGIHVRASDFTNKVSTANGDTLMAPVILDSVSIEDITVRNVRAVVAEMGKMQTTLLGMSFLSRLGKAEMSSGILVLRE